MNLNLTSAFKTVKTVITANSPVLLVGTAVAGVVATGVLAAKGGYAARAVIDAEQTKRDLAEPMGMKAAPLTVQEKVLLSWKFYAIPAVTGVSAIASIFGVHFIHTKRFAAMSTMYALTATKLDDVRAQAEELLGPKKTQALNEVVAQKQVDRAEELKGIPADAQVLMTGDGSQMFYDEYGGRWFSSSVAKVESAINDLNHQLLGGDATLNDFYSFLNLKQTRGGGLVGWNEGSKVSAQFDSALTADRTSAVSLWFHDIPRPDAVR